MYKYLPTYVYLSIYDIDFTKLYAKGIRNIIADLDNTLLPYYVLEPTDELKKWISDLKFNNITIYIISNNGKKRIEKVVNELDVSGFLPRANKPNAKKTKEYLKKQNLKLEETIFLGDQLVTDIACANNLGIESILVKTIDLKTQKWYTKINRLREKRIIKQIKKINPAIGNKVNNLYREES